MSGRMTIVPASVKLQEGGKIDTLDVHLAFGELPLDGRQARMIVYDYLLYTAFGRDLESDFSDTSDFRDPAKTGPLTPAAQLPPLEHPRFSTGVLLILNGILHRTAAGKWCWGPVEALSSGNAGRGLRVKVHQKTGTSRELNAVGIASYREVDLPRLKQGRLAVRVILLDATAGLERGTVLCSSLCPDHCTNPRLIPITDAAFAMMNAEIGGTGGKTPRQQPVMRKRVLPNDLSGMYEAVHPEGDQYPPPLCMQLNQAGHAIVGWFQTPHPGIMARIKSGPDVPNIPIDPGYFAGTITPGDSSIPIYWATSHEHRDPLPVRTELSQTGRLTHARGGPDDQEQEVRLVLSDADVTLDLTFTRRQAATRVSWWVYDRVLNATPLALRDALRFSNMEPIIDEYYVFLRSQVTAVNPQIVAAIVKWRDGDTSAKEAACSAVSNILLNALPVEDFGKKKFESEVTSRARELMAMSWTEGKTVLTWMYLMGGSEVDRARAKIARKTGKPAESIDPRSEEARSEVYQGFWSYRLLSGDSFLYQFSFFSGGVPLVIASFGVMTVQIKKLARIKTVADGEEFSMWFDRSLIDGFSGTVYYGAYESFGANLGLKMIFGGGGPGAIDTLSCMDLMPEDFVGACFSLTTTSALTATWFDPSFNVFNSALFEVWTDTFSLSADATDVFTGSLNKPKYFDPSTKAAPPDISAIKIAHVLGHFTHDEPRAQFDADQPPDPNASSVSGELGLQVLFNKDESSIDVGDLAHLEQHLAVFRKLTESQGGEIRTWGYASPEGRDGYNHNLSAERAVAVLQAVQGALGDAILVPPERQTFAGKGEGPSRLLGKLTDPPPLGPSGEWQFDSNMTPSDREALKKRLAHEERAAWPAWRMVWLILTGVAAMRVVAK